MTSSTARQLALTIGAAAKWLMPAARHEWVEAMLSDLRHIPCDRAAMRWACGCLRVSLNERLKFMIQSNDARPSWLLVTEMAACFIPPTYAWLAFIVDFAAAPSFAISFLAFAVLGALGPIGLGSTLRSAARGRPISRYLGGVLVAGSLSLALVIVAAFGAADFDSASVLRDATLIGLLPALGATHMLILRRRFTALAAA